MNRTTGSILFALALSAPLAGCAPVVVTGHALDAAQWASDARQIRARASFQLRCGEDRLALNVLAVLGGPFGARARQVGVEGCDQRLMMTLGAFEGTGWVVHSPSHSHFEPPAPTTVAVGPLHSLRTWAETYALNTN